MTRLKALEKRSFFEKHRCSLITFGVILVATLILTSLCPPKSTPVLTLSDGQVQGIVQYSRNGTEFWSFRGIPFAKPPIRELRFAPPVPNRKWEGIWQAKKYASACKQYDAMVFHHIDGNEDCLYLNVFTHPVNTSSGEDISGRPVMVYIAGGAFLSGASHYYHPEYIMDHNIVVVTFNYRLGPFGFLNLETETGDGSLPRGNQGLKDQVLLLKWVKRNIRAFGGDPERVTIFGQSAGAVSAHLHILSKASAGLFQRVIMHSGTGFVPWGFAKRGRGISRAFLEKVGCALDDREKLNKCLLECDADLMVQQQRSLMELELENDLLLPSVEMWRGDQEFLTELPEILAKRGQGAKVPAIFAVNEMEAAFRTARFYAFDDDNHLIPKFENNFSELLPKFLGFTSVSPNASRIVREHYFGNLSFTENPTKFKDILTTLTSAATVFEQNDRAARYHAQGPARTYLLYYRYKPIALPSMYTFYKAIGRNDWLPRKMKVEWVAFMDYLKEFLLGWGRPYVPVHGDDILQLWDLNGETGILSFFEREFSEDFVELMVAFVKGRESMEWRGVDWEAMEGNNVKYLEVGNGQGKMVEDPFEKDIEFWRGVGSDKFIN